MSSQTNSITNENKKWCTFCGRSLPVNQFGIDKYQPDGRRQHCNSCRKIIDDEAVDGLDPRLSELEEQSLESLQRLNAGGSFTPSITELLESLLRPFGGSDGFGKALYATYLAAEPGSKQRVAVLKEIMMLAKSNSALSGDSLSLESMTDADLEQAMRSSLLEYQRRTGKTANELPPITLESKGTAKGDGLSLESLGVEVSHA